MERAGSQSFAACSDPHDLLSNHRLAQQHRVRQDLLPRLGLYDPLLERLGGEKPGLPMRLLGPTPRSGTAAPMAGSPCGATKAPGTGWMLRCWPFRRSLDSLMLLKHANSICLHTGIRECRQFD